MTRFEAVAAELDFADAQRERSRWAAWPPEAPLDPAAAAAFAVATPEEQDRIDAACAAEARADGLGLFVCPGCDRPGWVCQRDPATHERRAASRAGTERAR